jgi:small subunit ribosomal protein S24e
VFLLVVDIKILEVKENKLLKRREIRFEIEHLGTGTPNRLEVKNKLAALQTAKPELTFIIDIKTVFGLPKSLGNATVYDDAQLAEKLEPNYIKIRNMDKDKRDDARKAVKRVKKKKKKAGGN